MDLLTFTLMVLTSVDQVQVPRVKTWDWQTWTSCDRGIWIDVKPAYNIGGAKFNMDGSPWKW